MKVVIRLHSLDSCLELNINDARMMQTLTRIQKLDDLLKSSSILHYHHTILPLITAFYGSLMKQTCLEDLVKKDAVEKYEAKQEELLADFEVDFERTMVKSGNLSKFPKDKMKEKKKRMHNRKAKNVVPPMAPDDDKYLEETAAMFWRNNFWWYQVLSKFKQELQRHICLSSRLSI